MTIEFKNKSRVVAIEDESIVGYIKICMPNDISKERNLDICYVYVSPEYRRKGIASKMLNFILDHYKNVIWVSMWTSRECEIDKSWIVYLKAGFEQTVYLEDYYEDGIGTRYFCKKLK